MARLFKTGVTAEGDISTSGFLKSTNSSGDEGGQIDLTKSVTNTTLTTGVTIDVWQNRLRLFETGGTNRGYYIDISGGATSAGTNLVSGFTGGTLTSSLTLRSGTATASTAPLYFGNSSPAVLTTPVTGAVEYDGKVFYSTPNATTGRAVAVSSYYFVSDGNYGVDHSTVTTAKPIFGSATTGITLVAGTTYEVEMNVAVSINAVGVSTPAWSHSWLTLTAGATPTYYQEISISTNTTSQATSSTVSRRRVINNAAVEVLATTAAGSQRHSIYTVKGIIRVTGSGTVEVAPAATASFTSVDFSFVALNGSYIKITPLGNGTVTNVGNAWA